MANLAETAKAVGRADHPKIEASNRPRVIRTVTIFIYPV